MVERHDDLDYVADQIKRLHVKNVVVDNEESQISWSMDGKEIDHIDYFRGLQHMLVNIVKSKYWKLDILSSTTIRSTKEIMILKKTGLSLKEILELKKAGLELLDKDSERILTLTRVKADVDGVITESMHKTIKDSLDQARIPS